MNHNVQAATQRGDNVNTLVNKTDDLREASRGFHSSAKRARRQMFKKNVWMTILVIVGVLIVIGIIVGIGTWNAPDQVGEHETNVLCSEGRDGKEMKAFGRSIQLRRVAGFS